MGTRPARRRLRGSPEPEGEGGEGTVQPFHRPRVHDQNVEIADDPSIGIEPLAYVDSIEARVTLRTFWTRKLSFSNLKFKEPTLNLVKSDSGVWNFQLLHPTPGAVPTIQVRDGRITLSSAT